MSLTILRVTGRKSGMWANTAAGQIAGLTKFTKKIKYRQNNIKDFLVFKVDFLLSLIYSAFIKQQCTKEKKIYRD